MKFGIQILQKAQRTFLKSQAAVTEATGVRTAKPASFIQIRSHGTFGTSAAQKAQALRLLQREVERSNNEDLRRLLLEVQSRLEGDGDVGKEVDAMLEKQLWKMREDQTTEDEKWQWCVAETKKTKKQKTNKEDDMEKLTNGIQSAQGSVTELQGEIKEATKRLSDLQKSSNEFKMDRQESKNEHQLALRDAKLAQEALSGAIGTLNKFYEEAAASLLQSVKPTDVAEAPETWSKGFSGTGQDGKGPGEAIIKVLEDCSADFAQMEAETKSQEVQEEADFDKEMIDAKKEKVRLQTEKSSKEEEEARLSEKIRDMSEKKKMTDRSVALLAKYHEDLSQKCNQTAYEARTAERKVSKVELQKSQELFQRPSTALPLATQLFVAVLHEKIEQLKQLEGHQQQWASTARTLYDGLKEEVAQSISFERFLELFAQCAANAHEVDGAQGAAIFVLGSMAEHSCRPNAFKNVQGSQLTVRAMEDLVLGEKTPELCCAFRCPECEGPCCPSTPCTELGGFCELLCEECGLRCSGEQLEAFKKAETLEEFKGLGWGGSDCTLGAAPDLGDGTAIQPGPLGGASSQVPAATALQIFPQLFEAFGRLREEGHPFLSQLAQREAESWEKAHPEDPDADAAWHRAAELFALSHGAESREAAQCRARILPQALLKEAFDASAESMLISLCSLAGRLQRFDGMRWVFTVLSSLVLIRARHFENDDSLDSVDADDSLEEGFKPADPWRVGAQRVDGNDCKNVIKLGDQAYNCPSYYVASDLTTGSCRTPCFNPTKSCLARCSQGPRAMPPFQRRDVTGSSGGGSSPQDSPEAGKRVWVGLSLAHRLGAAKRGSREAVSALHVWTSGDSMNDLPMAPLSAMAEPSRVRAQGVSKSILEQSEMDLTNLRIGKQRLVSKKKRLSCLGEGKLKKTILEDREYRAPGSVLPLAENAPRPVGLVAAPAVVEPFMPSWCMEEEEASERQKVEEEEEKENDLGEEPDEPEEAEEPDEPVDEKEREEKARDALLAMSISETLQRLTALPTLSGARPKAATADLEVRHYVHQELSDELDEKVKFVLGELVRFQERAKEQNAMKYAKLKRFCVGLREAKRAINRKKCKGLVVAPNLEVSTLEGGLDDTVEELIELARENEVPVIFALSRNRIGKAMGKSIRLSIVALHSVDGVHQQFKELVKLAEELRPLGQSPRWNWDGAGV
ncbi:unnamed protein product [Cladocopium goreaui]|uniref:Ribosomal protein eL8/eL30/eS12/Gadd45 domain-containing protein n=1 Tax=Cladocopium goreaui TaxID=2562237 RepID=A0A9P1G8Q2_9DINO|nr:unnamed protein product [Cladocopium goreaui]